MVGPLCAMYGHPLSLSLSLSLTLPKSAQEHPAENTKIVHRRGVSPSMMSSSCLHRCNTFSNVAAPSVPFLSSSKHLSTKGRLPELSRNRSKPADHEQKGLLSTVEAPALDFQDETPEPQYEQAKGVAAYELLGPSM